MISLKIGIAIGSLRLPLAQALDAAARSGADAVEIDARHDLKPAELSQTGLRQLRKLLEERRLRVSAVSYLTRRGYNVTDQLDKRVAGTKEAMKLAYQLGAPAVVNQIGLVPAKAEGPEWNLLVEVLSDLGRFGEHNGARLAATTGSGGEGAELARLLAALPEGSIGVDFDPGNLLINGLSPQEAVAALGQRILHVHATDGVRDLARGRGSEVALAAGAADYPNLLGQLEEQNYRGYFTVTCRATGSPLAECDAAIQYLHSL